MTRGQRRACTWVSIAGMTLALGVDAASKTRLGVFPDRVVLASGQRHANLTVANRSAHEASYRLELAQFAMSDDGALVPETAEMADARPLAPYLRLEPDYLRLEAGQRSFIRITGSWPDDMAEGEWRSHLVVSLVAGQSGGDEPLRVLVPLILRVGRPATTLATGELGLVAPGHRGMSPVLTLPIQVSGGASCLGDLRVVLLREGQSDRVVAERKGMSLMPRPGTVTIQVPLEWPEFRHGGRLRVRFTGREPQHDPPSFTQETLVAPTAAP